MVFLPNPPGADKSLRYAQKIILGILTHMPVEDPGFLTGLVPVLQRGGYFYHMPFYPVLFSGGS